MKNPLYRLRTCISSRTLAKLQNTTSSFAKIKKNYLKFLSFTKSNCECSNTEAVAIPGWCNPDNKSHVSKGRREAVKHPTRVQCQITTHKTAAQKLSPLHHSKSVASPATFARIWIFKHESPSIFFLCNLRSNFRKLVLLLLLIIIRSAFPRKKISFLHYDT